MWSGVVRASGRHSHNHALAYTSHSISLGERMHLIFSLLLALGATSSVLAAISVPKADVARHAETLLEHSYPDAKAPGVAILIARGDEVLYRGARGAANIERGTMLSPDNVFRVGSITKQFTAAAILKLAGEGRLSLDDPLNKFVGDYPNGKAITIRQLLGHTSGIKNYFEIPEVVSNRIQHHATTAEIIESFRSEPVKFLPGEGFAYSNSGYVLLGSVIESVTGMPWHQYLRDALFLPLGMKQTGYEEDFRKLIPVEGYSTENSNIVPATPMSLSWAHAAAGLSSTLDDLLVWNNALHGGRILGDEQYLEMTTPGSGEGGQYGLGMAIESLQGSLAYGHSGAINGFSSCLMHVQESGITVIVMENNDGGETGEGACPLARQLAAMAANIADVSEKPMPR